MRSLKGEESVERQYSDKFYPARIVTIFAIVACTDEEGRGPNRDVSYYPTHEEAEFMSPSSRGKVEPRLAACFEGSNIHMLLAQEGSALPGPGAPEIEIKRVSPDLLGDRLEETRQRALKKLTPEEKISLGLAPMPNK